MSSNRIFEQPNGTFKGQAEYHYVNPVGMAVGCELLSFLSIFEI